MSFSQVTASLLGGFLENCKLFALTLLLALPLGLLCMGDPRYSADVAAFCGAICAGAYLWYADEVAHDGCAGRICNQLRSLFFGNLSRWY